MPQHITLDLTRPDDEEEARRLLPELFHAKAPPAAKKAPPASRKKPDAPPAVSGRRYCLALPFHTALANELLKKHWGRAAGLKKRDREAVKEAGGHLPPAAGKRRVRLTVLLEKGQRAPDPDAWQKSLGDALVQAGLLVDDGPKWCEWPPTEYARGKRRALFIELEDLAA